MSAALPPTRVEESRLSFHACRFCYMNPDELRNSCEAPEEVHILPSMHVLPSYHASIDLRDSLRSAFFQCHHTLASMHIECCILPNYMQRSCASTMIWCMLMWHAPPCRLHVKGLW